MGRIYAGVLGPIAFLVELARGAWHDQEMQTMLSSASVSLLAFALLGYIAGHTAGWLVSESARSRFAAQQPGEPAARIIGGGSPGA